MYGKEKDIERMEMNILQELNKPSGKDHKFFEKYLIRTLRRYAKGRVFEGKKIYYMWGVVVFYNKGILSWRDGILWDGM